MKLTNTYSFLTKFIAAAVDISEKSANILREIKASGELNVREKAANDYVTKADFQSQLNIVKSLENLFPNIRICGEEGELKDEYNDSLITSLNDEVLKNAEIIPQLYESLKDEDVLVWVDPLDATREYTEGYNLANEVTILIGVAWNGRPIAGVINQPFSKKTSDSYSSKILWGIVGLGVFEIGGAKLTVPDTLSDNVRIAIYRRYLPEAFKRDLYSIPNASFMYAAGCGYKAMKILEGVADYYIFPIHGAKKWDTCAPEALMRSIGGEMTDMFGREYVYDKYDSKSLDINYGLLFSIQQTNKEFLKNFSEDTRQEIIEEAKKLEAKLQKING